MNCHEIQEELGVWMDGELSTAQGEELESHLFICATCRLEEQALRKLESALMKRVERAVEIHRSRRTWAWAAAAALVIVGGSLWLQAKSMEKRFDEYVAAAGVRRKSLERELLSRGAGLYSVLGTELKSGDIRRQFAAAELLAQCDETEAVELLMSSSLTAEGPMEGADLLPWASDADLRDGLVSIACEPEYRNFVLDNLWRVDLLTLLRSDDPQLQSKAVEVLLFLKQRLHVSLRFEIPELIELLDSAALGQKSLEVLRHVTGQDIGRDPVAWRAWWERVDPRGRSM